MSGSKAVVGIFHYLDDTVDAIERAKENNWDYTVYSPFANHELEHATYPEKSPVRFLTCTGAILGLTAGFTLAIMCSLDWPLRVSAKDIVSVPGFVVIGYECTILFAAIFTLLSVLHFCRIPDVMRKVGFDPRFTCDKFGVVVSCDSKDVDDVKSTFTDNGAEEVDVRDAL